jgi:DNA polymerase
MPSAPDERRIAYLRSMGITPWLLRERPVAGAAPDAAAAGEQPVTTMDWAALRATVADCRLCPLHESRTQAVFGVGNPQADWLIIGEAPGAEEDRRGEPFVGRAGQLLDAMLAALGLSRQTVYIANILKCRPPNNRDPQPEEALACAPYLDRQIELIEPGLIVALGRVAAQRLLGTEAPLGRLRGTVHRYGARDIPVIVTYHPAYLLRRPGEKSKSWRDLLFAASVLREAAG